MTQTHCDRCGEPFGGRAQITSMFNLEVICSDCKDAEVRHPLYGYALLKDEHAIAAGNFNYPGIGKPEDL